MYVFLFLIIIYYYYYYYCCRFFFLYVCEFPQKNSRMAEKKTELASETEWRRQNLILLRLIHSDSWATEHTVQIYPKMCCLKPTFKCIFHIRFGPFIKRSGIWVFQCYLDTQTDKNWRESEDQKKKKHKTKITHTKTDQKNAFIEDFAFVAAAAKFVFSFT